MRLIDGEALYKEVAESEEKARDRFLDTSSSLLCPSYINPAYTRYNEQLNERTRLKHMIADAPTIDAVEVVRCKDCKFWQNQEEGVIEVPICARPENKCEKLPFRFMIGKDGFCSFAERRSDE